MNSQREDLIKVTISIILLIASFVSVPQSSLADVENHLDVPVYIDGEIRSIGGLAKGRPSLLVFWGVDCGFCRKETPALNALQQELGQSVLILAINNDQAFDAIMRVPDYVKTHNLKSIVVKDPRSIISAHFSVPGTPTAIVLDRYSRLQKQTYTNFIKLKSTLKKLIKNT